MQRRSVYSTSWQKRLVTLLLIVASFLLAGCLDLVLGNLSASWNNEINDKLFRLRYRLRGRISVSPFLVHVVFGDSTYEALRVSTSDRSVFGQVLETLNDANAKLIACDIFFEYPGFETQDRMLVDATSNMASVIYPIIIQPSQYTEILGDIRTATAESEVVNENLVQPVIVRNGKPPQSHFASIPFLALSKAAKGLGHINCYPDPDGIYRRVPLLYRVRDGYVPAISLKMILDHYAVDERNIEVRFGKSVLLKHARVRDDVTRNVSIPIDSQGRIIVNFAGPWEDSFINFPAHKLIGSRNDGESWSHLYDLIDNSLVVISDISTRNKDYGPGVFDEVYPLGGLHMNIVNSILTESYLADQPLYQSILAILVMVCLTALFAYRLQGVGFSMASTCLYIVFFLYSLWLFLYQNQMPTTFVPTLGVVFTLIAVNAYRLVVSEREKTIYRVKWEANQELEVINKRLENKKNELEVTNEKLREIDRFKTEFIQNITRVFRTPLSLILGPLESIRTKMHEGPTDFFKKNLDVVFRNAQRLSLLANRFLGFSTKIDSGVGGADQKLSLNEDRSKTDPDFPIETSRSSDIQWNVEAGIRAKSGRLFRQPILVIAGNQKLRQHVCSVLVSRSEVVEATNAKMGLEMAERLKPDLILLESSVPDMDCREVVGRLKGIVDVEDTPIILVTDSSSGDIRVQDVPCEIAARISEPFTSQDLIACVAKAIKEKIRTTEAGAFEERRWEQVEGSYPEDPILIVDDEREILDSYKSKLVKNGLDNFILCQDAEKLLPFVEEGPLSVVVLNPSMPGICGTDLLEDLREEHPEIPVLVVTGLYDIDMAVECVKLGAFDYMVKPVDFSRFISNLNHCIKKNEMEREINILRNGMQSQLLKNPEAFSEIVTNNEAMLMRFRYVEAISESANPVLITGESGVGKELIAKVIHGLNSRSGKFVTENIAGLDDSMINDVLFGHAKGAYTGADGIREGLIEQAQGGTLFLDEIGDMGHFSQTKLLRFLEEREYRSLGSDATKLSDVRVIASTNADIAQLQKEGRFRKDLFHRFTYRIDIPPLRDRLDDLPFLVDHFLEQAAEVLGKEKPAVRQELLAALESYHFPGNVRELKNIIDNAVSRSNSEDLPLSYFREYVRANSDSTAKRKSSVGLEEKRIVFTGDFPTLKEIENIIISEALKRAKGNQNIAADLLGLSPSALSRRLKKLRDGN